MLLATFFAAPLLCFRAPPRTRTAVVPPARRPRTNAPTRPGSADRHPAEATAAVVSVRSGATWTRHTSRCFSASLSKNSWASLPRTKPCRPNRSTLSPACRAIRIAWAFHPIRARNSASVYTSSARTTPGQEMAKGGPSELRPLAGLGRRLSPRSAAWFSVVLLTHTTSAFLQIGTQGGYHPFALPHAASPIGSVAPSIGTCHGPGWGCGVGY